MWTTKIYKIAATVAMASLFSQAYAGESATCYVVTGNKVTPVNCIKSVVEKHSKGPLKLCRTVDKNADSADYLSKTTTYSLANGTVIQEKNSSLVCGASGDGWNMQEKTNYLVNGKPVTMQYRNLDTGNPTSLKVIEKTSNDYFGGKLKSQPRFASCVSTSKSGESVCF